MADNGDDVNKETEQLHLQKKRKTVTESNKSTASKYRKLTSYFTVISASTSAAATAVRPVTDDEVVQDEIAAQETASEVRLVSENVQITTPKQKGKQIGCSLNLYRGYPLNIKKIQDKVGKEALSVYSNKIGSRKRLLAKCSICSKFEEDAKKKSRHGTVYLAHGVRCDSEEKLKRIVDHLYSKMHKAAVDAKNCKELWDNQSQNHPWVRVLQKQEQVTVESLIKLAIDVYNDSKLLTPSAWSWPARSLATAHAEKQISSLKENGLESPFIPFEPSPTDLHYKDPVRYKEMLTIIAELENMKLKNELQEAIKFSTQIDGSVDTMQHDNKFLFVKYNIPKEPLEVRTKFVAVGDSELRGAAGLEDCVLTGLKSIGVDKSMMKEKFSGVTTGGESANTGYKSIDFPGGKRRRNIKMRAQFMIFMWRGIMTEIKHKVFKTTLLTFRCGRATSSE